MPYWTDGVLGSSSGEENIPTIIRHALLGTWLIGQILRWEDYSNDDKACPVGQMAYSVNPQMKRSFQRYKTIRHALLVPIRHASLGACFSRQNRTYSVGFTCERGAPACMHIEVASAR